MSKPALHSDFMKAAEIEQIVANWARNPLENLRLLKDAGKQMTHIRLNFQGVYNSGLFKASQRAMNYACSTLVGALRTEHSAFKENFEIHWKMATLLSHTERYVEALEFVEHAEQIMSETERVEKGSMVADKKSDILIQLAYHNPFKYGKQAVEAAEALNQSDTKNQRRLEKARKFAAQNMCPVVNGSTLAHS